MTVSEAQRELRSIHLGAFSGFIVTGLVWLLSAAIGAWASPGLAIRSRGASAFDDGMLPQGRG